MSIIQTLRHPILTESQIKEVVDALEQNCKHVLPAAVPPEATWYLSTNAAVQVRPLYLF